ncbi:MAG TPA: CHASE3 domain-containing protein, partial [Acidovorax sp.]|nr:CHASE3 domain-containing protein [Acidovorax sp.]
MTFQENSRHWLRKSRSMAVSLPFALLAALVLIGINEAGHMRSQQAVEEMNQGQQTRNAVNRLLQSMLDAETGQRGYLLTGNESYLEPYDKAVATVHTNLDELRTRYLQSPEDLQQFANLSREVSRKLAEMELSLRLRRQGNEDAWKFILFTDVGKEHMESIRQQAHALIDRSAQKVQESRHQILQSLMLSRIGIATVTAIGLLAFSMYLRQARTLQQVNQREQELLERERERLEGLVRERTASLSELASHLQQVREDERGYLARELHDELGALLTAAKLDVARLKSKIDHQAPDIAERLRHLTETLNSGIALKRRIIEDLRPSSLSNLGLTAAL